MSDRLSQLQTCLDQLVTQFFSSINHINQHHDFKVPENSPGHVAKVEDPQAQAVPSEQLNGTIKELSKDIVTKAKQIEVLIDSLPELENVTEDLENLEAELERARSEEAEAAKERDGLLEQCDDLIMRVTAYKTDVDRLTL